MTINPLRAEVQLTESAKQGQKILMTSCGLCHEKPDILNPAVAPCLDRNTLWGKKVDIIAYIKIGSNVMPIFQYMYSDDELQHVADYILSRPAEAAASHDKKQ